MPATGALDVGITAADVYTFRPPTQTSRTRSGTSDGHDDVRDRPVLMGHQVVIAADVQEDEISQVADFRGRRRGIPEGSMTTLPDTFKKGLCRDSLACLGLGETADQAQLVPVISIVTKSKPVEPDTKVDGGLPGIGDRGDARREAQVGAGVDRHDTAFGGQGRHFVWPQVGPVREAHVRAD